MHCPGQNLYEYRTQFSVYAVAASPLIVSTDIRNMTSIMKQILLNKKVIAVNQQTTPPGDVVGEIAGVDPSGADKVQVWTRATEVKPGVVALAVAAVNFANSTRTVKIPLAMLNARWGKTTTVSVDDLWESNQHEGALPKETGALAVTIYPHDTKMLQLTLG